jgi:hypothetical protein
MSLRHKIPIEALAEHNSQQQEKTSVSGATGLAWTGLYQNAWGQQETLTLGNLCKKWLRTGMVIQK